MDAVFLITILGLIVAVFLAHVRVQRMSGKVEAATEWAVNNYEGYEDCADAIQAWGTKTQIMLNDVAVATQTMRMHSAQLKGAGERLRKLEANMASTDMTVACLLQPVQSEPSPESAVVIAKPLRKKTAPALSRLEVAKVRADILKLRADILGGADSDGLPIIGVLADLRQQVEGINANLGRKVGSFSKRVGDLESSQVPVARAAVRRMMEQQPRGLKRLWGWMKSSVGS